MVLLHGIAGNGNQEFYSDLLSGNLITHSFNTRVMSNITTLTLTERIEDVKTREVVIPSYYQDTFIPVRYTAIVSEDKAIIVTKQLDYTAITVCHPETLTRIDRLKEVDYVEFLKVFYECRRDVEAQDSLLKEAF